MSMVKKKIKPLTSNDCVLIVDALEEWLRAFRNNCDDQFEPEDLENIQEAESLRDYFNGRI
jgi:hypothetical protein